MSTLTDQQSILQMGEIRMLQHRANALTGEFFTPLISLALDERKLKRNNLQGHSAVKGKAIFTLPGEELHNIPFEGMKPHILIKMHLFFP